jgi:hypothetical protein
LISNFYVKGEDFMIWPWQYKKKIKEYEARIAELKLAGWTACSGWYRATGYLNRNQYDKVAKDYNWLRENAIFAHDKPIDGPRPNFTAYYVSGQKKPDEIR